MLLNITFLLNIQAHQLCNMDNENDYAVAKKIVQSGQSDEDWDALRSGKGAWPDDYRKEWRQYRKYSLDKLVEMMEAYKQNKGINSRSMIRSVL